MKTRDVAIGLLVLVVLISGVLILKNSKKNRLQVLPSPTPSISEKVTQKFGGLTIPNNADTADLTDVSGGVGLGEAVKTTGTKFELTVLADLVAPKAGYFYQAWIVRGNPGDTDFSYLSIGKLRVAKGGYIVDFSSAKDYSSYKKVVVTLEKVFDNTPEQHILEGSF